MSEQKETVPDWVRVLSKSVMDKIEARIVNFTYQYSIIIYGEEKTHEIVIYPSINQIIGGKDDGGSIFAIYNFYIYSWKKDCPIDFKIEDIIYNNDVSGQISIYGKKDENNFVIRVLGSPPENAKVEAKIVYDKI